MKEWKSRENIVYNLPDDIKFNIIRHTDEFTDVYNIIGACYNSDHGVDHLLHILRYFEGNTRQMHKVEKLWREFSSPMETVFSTLFFAGCLWALLVYMAATFPNIYITPLGLFIYLIPTIVTLLAAVAIPLFAWLQAKNKPEEDLLDLIEEEDEDLTQPETGAGINAL